MPPSQLAPHTHLLPEHPGGGLGVGLVVGHQCPEAPTWDQGIWKMTFLNDN